MLCFDPSMRISCEKALEHPYFAVLHDPSDEPVCSEPFDFGFEDVEDMPGMKTLISEEVNSFRMLVRSEARQQIHARRQDSLPIPTHDDIIASPAMENGATSGYTFPHPSSQTPVEDLVEEPGAELDRELGAYGQ